MNSFFIPMVFVTFLVVVSGIATEAKADGKKIFLDAKCNKCHTIKSLSIDKLPKTAVVAEEDEEEEEVLDASGKKIEPKDMKESVAAAKKENVDIAKWLMKETANKENRKHKKKFKGTADDLKTLVDWLKTL